MRIKRNTSGQTVVPEYALVIFVVVTAVVVSTVYIQRMLQARMRDAKIYMVDQAAAACAAAGPECLNAAGAQGGKFAYEYEPYYGKIATTADRAQDNTKSLEINGIFRSQGAQQTVINSVSEQLPPGMAD